MDVWTFALLNDYEHLKIWAECIPINDSKVVSYSIAFNRIVSHHNWVRQLPINVLQGWMDGWIQAFVSPFKTLKYTPPNLGSFSTNTTLYLTFHFYNTNQT